MKLKLILPLLLCLSVFYCSTREEKDVMEERIYVDPLDGSIIEKDVIIYQEKGDSSQKNK